MSILKIFGTPTSELLLAPDTNSLLKTADPTAYRQAAGRDDFFFILFPTVLRELDELKILHRVPEVREKAQKAIARIKGWRNQGPLLSGVVVDRTIQVRAVAEEPNPRVLSWLDPDSADDRLVASVLGLLSERPSDEVILVTGDINLQNKADAAGITVREL